MRTVLIVCVALVFVGFGCSNDIGIVLLWVGIRGVNRKNYYTDVSRARLAIKYSERRLQNGKGRA